MYWRYNHLDAEDFDRDYEEAFDPSWFYYTQGYRVNPFDSFNPMQGPPGPPPGAGQGMGPGMGPGGPGGLPGQGVGPAGPGGPGANKPPSGPPPAMTPSKAQAQAQVKAVSPATIRPCLFRFVYIWPRFGMGFWAYLIFADRRSVAGWRWNGRRWLYFAMDLRRIDSFICY